MFAVWTETDDSTAGSLEELRHDLAGFVTWFLLTDRLAERVRRLRRHCLFA